MTARDQYMAYCYGWSDAAGSRAMRQDYLKHADAAVMRAYMEGYKVGYDARHEAHKSAAEKYRYTPAIIRAA